MLLELFRTQFGRGIAGLDRFTAKLGEEVFDSGRVSAVSEIAPGVLCGTVHETQDARWSCTVRLTAHGALSRFASECNCPTGTDCEHGAALLLAWLVGRQRDSRTGASRSAACFPGHGLPDPYGMSASSATTPDLQSDAPHPPTDHPTRTPPSAQAQRPLPAVVAPGSATAGPAATLSEYDNTVADASAQDSFNRLRALEWIRALREVPAGAANPNKRTATLLVWVLELDTPRATLTPLRMRTRPDGRYDPPEACRVPLEPVLAPSSSWDESDVRAIKLLAGASQNGGAIELNGLYCSEALLGLVGAGKVFLQHAPDRPDTPPLKLGPARAAQLQWSAPPDQAEHRVRLALQVTPTAEALLFARPCWIDRALGELGPIADPPPAALVEWLRHAPSIAACHADEIAHALHAQRRARPLLQALLPSLPGGQVRERLGQPGPIVGVFEIASNDSAAGPLLAVSCAVDYDGRRIEPLRTTTLSMRDEQGPLLLVCDTAREQAVVATLRAALATLEATGEVVGWSPATAAATPRGRIESGWLTIASVPTGSVAAARLRALILPRLAEQGWTVVDSAASTLVVLDADQVELALHSTTQPATLAGNAHPTQGWFELQSGICIGERRIDLAPLLAEAVAAGGVEVWSRRAIHEGKVWWRISEHEVLRIAATRILPLLHIVADWVETGASAPQPGARIDALAAAALAASLPDLAVPEPVAMLRRMLESFAKPVELDPPATFKATLRGYQRKGLGWLQFIARSGSGGILADDMGLGKTVQVLAHLATEHAAGHLTAPALVIAPTSVVFNWQEEAQRYAPNLRVLALVGPERGDSLAAIQHSDVVLTSWALLARDAVALCARHWHVIVADEAHFAKNPRTRAATVLRSLQANHRIALTGTPLENHLGELWSIMGFAVPGLLGHENAFRLRFRTPIEKRVDEQLAAERLEVLERRIRPFLLRRTKAEVLNELPPCTEIVHRVTLGRAQRDLYESLRAMMDERVRDAFLHNGRERSRIVVLDALLKMRQACCDPGLLALPAARKVRESAKLDALRELLTTLIERGRRVLVFSQFTSMLDRIELALDQDPELASVARTRLDGDTTDRRSAVRAFQDGAAAIFLLSLKAGGVGLNLTAADTVIHFDPWWNPAVESQATDRAHRIGQRKPVFVYKLITAGTIEERILELQSSKANLAEAVLAGGQAAQTLSSDDLLALLESA